jgi:Glucosamine-6-phosphate isomerases/6-phosphogluconolactonase
MKVGSEAKLEILADIEALARRFADWLCAILTASTARGGALAVALSGGGTPRRLYEVLAGPSRGSCRMMTVALRLAAKGASIRSSRGRAGETNGSETRPKLVFYLPRFVS